MNDFDPNAPASADAGIFGLPWKEKEAQIVIIPVPWDVTVSYAAGTSHGPGAILEASAQVDLFHPDMKDAWKSRIWMAEPDKLIRKKNKKFRKQAEKYIRHLTENISGIPSVEMNFTLQDINASCHEMNQWVYSKSRSVIDSGKIPVILGGDHSTPLGQIQAFTEKYDHVSLLQIDAHCDLRESYEGFESSHASVMYNALKENNVKKLVQVGIRDWCEEEEQRIIKSKGRIRTFYDRDIQDRKFQGENWNEITDEIVDSLGDYVYLSMDIDGLDPALCPHTGTPVPGGLSFPELIFLIRKLWTSGKKIIGFDLVEVAPGKDEWDANVGARLLWHACIYTLLSHHTARPAGNKPQKTVKSTKK